MDKIETTQSTALVCIGTDRDPVPARLKAVRPDASFVAQLLATAAMTAQTRRLRRASSSEAARGYNRASPAAALPSGTTGKRLSRVA